MANLGLGIIGCGNISTAYLRLAPLFKGLEVRAVADVNMEAAKARAEEFNVRAQSVDDLLANRDVDVVINLTIPDAHYTVTKRILEAGKHAYSEKPLVLTLDEGTTVRIQARSWRGSRFAGSSHTGSPSSRTCRASSSRLKASRGRRMPPAAAGIAARPAGPEPPSTRMSTVSAWSSA